MKAYWEFSFLKTLVLLHQPYYFSLEQTLQKQTRNYCQESISFFIFFYWTGILKLDMYRSLWNKNDVFTFTVSNLWVHAQTLWTILFQYKNDNNFCQLKSKLSPRNFFHVFQRDRNHFSVFWHLWKISFINNVNDGPCYDNLKNEGKIKLMSSICQITTELESPTRVDNHLNCRSSAYYIHNVTI